MRFLLTLTLESLVDIVVKSAYASTSEATTQGNLQSRTTSAKRYASVINMSKVATEDQAQPPEVKSEPEKDQPVPSLDSLIKALSDKQDADIYLYSGLIEKDGAARFIEVAEQYKNKNNCILILTTYGGTADAAYKIVRHLKRTYQRFILYVCGPCKSAGTLLALGADEIVMSGVGEFGPLDVQLIKRDDLFFRNSGLDIAEALRSISEHTFHLFEKQFLEMLMRSGGAISTKTASEIAKDIAVGLLSPITGQIDPIQIGEARRAVRVAKDYATRLKANPATIKRLVEGYPSHTFVIDFEEAKELFEHVRLTQPLEEILAITLAADSAEATGHDCVREPYPHDVIVMPLALLEESDDQEQEQDTPQNGNSDDNETNAGNKTD